ncbi:hypothetical protein [Methylobacterium sp. CM6257]
MREDSIIARNAAEAIEAAKRIRVDMISSDANAIFLTGPNGHVIWSLRLGDVWL